MNSDITPQDAARFSSQLAKVRAVMADGAWHTLSELATLCGCSESGASARVRDLRKQRFGSNTIERQRISGGLWEYRLADNQNGAKQ